MPNWIGFPELMVILVIILLLFGAKKLPEIAKSLGQSIKTFKKSMNEGLEEEGEKKPSDLTKTEGMKKGENPADEKK